jgi:radical SAM family uncharacterized protein
MHEFFDLFVIGEAEEAIVELMDVYRPFKRRGGSDKINKQELLIALSVIEGVYVPSFYDVAYGIDGRIRELKPKISGAPLSIKKRFIKDLDQAYFPSRWITPYIQVVHDRIAVEVMRGCPNKCRFCQGRAQYFPLRFRSADRAVELACEAYNSSGYEELSLCGLSVSDYPYIEDLLKSLVSFFRGKAVSVSLPSMKPKSYTGSLSSLLATIKKTGLTFAPEAATQRLRDIINKDFDMESFLKSIEKAYLDGYQHIKLYFMIGLPYERDSDLEEIINFSSNLSNLRRKVAKSPAQINISINSLISKPHTPFQWLKTQGLETIKYKQDYLRSRLRNKRLKLNFHNRYMSLLEGVFSRGDRRLSQVVLNAFKAGARFDAWNDLFVFQKWEDAFAQAGVDYNFYLQEKPRDEILAWDFIDTGIPKSLLLEEYDKIIDIE